MHKQARLSCPLKTLLVYLAGLVPTLSDNHNGNSPQEDLLNSNGNAAAVHSAHEEHDLLVPSFSLSLPDELPLPQLGGGAPKRPAEDATDALLPASKQQRPSSYSMSAQQSAPFQLKQESQVPAPMMAAPQWQAAPAPALAPPPPPHRQPVHTTTTHHAPGYGAGAELTREQRVARWVLFFARLLCRVSIKSCGRGTLT